MADTIVHVTPPKSAKHAPFQFSFDETDTDEEILTQLEGIKRVMGYHTTIVTQQTVGGKSVSVGMPDKSSGFMYDHPETIVAVGHEGPNRSFVEDRRLKGPKKEETKT